MIGRVHQRGQINLRSIGILVLLSLVCFSLLNNSFCFAVEQEEWDVTMTITASNGLLDTLVFGERYNASDGKDNYDMPKPPAPQPPYVRTWFRTDLSLPHNMLWEEYRSFPSLSNTWDFIVRYEDASENSSIVTLSWDHHMVQKTKYEYMNLSFNDQVVADMLSEQSYSYTQLVGTSQPFRIICEGIIDSNNEGEQDTANMLIPVMIIVLFLFIVVLIYMYYIKKRK